MTHHIRDINTQALDPVRMLMYEAHSVKIAFTCGRWGLHLLEFAQ